MVAWPKSQTPLQLQRPMPTFSSPVATHAQSPFLRVNFPKETHQSQQVGATKRGEEDNFRGGCSIRRGLTPKSLNPDPPVHKQLQRPMPTFSSPVATHAQSPRLSTYSPILAQVPTPQNLSRVVNRWTFVGGEHMDTLRFRGREKLGILPARGDARPVAY